MPSKADDFMTAHPGEGSIQDKMFTLYGGPNKTQADGQKEIKGRVEEFDGAVST